MNVWATLCGNGAILGPFFFDANINDETYLAMINNQVVPEMMERFQYNLFEDQWWFQDGAGAHRARAVMDRLQELFGPQIVSLGHNKNGHQEAQT